MRYRFKVLLLIKINKIMKYIIQQVIVLTCLLSVISCSNSITENNVKDHDDKKEVNKSAPVDFPVAGYDFYGMAEVKPKEAISVEEMIRKIQNTGSFEGHVNATLDGVCKKMGCWITMVNKSGESVRVRFKDHEFGVPTDTPVGASVVLVGIGKTDTVSVAMQKHYLDDAKETGDSVSQEQYDAITEDLINISFVSDGILVKK